MKVAWLSDLHLNHADDATREALYAEVRDTGAALAVLSGDLAESPELAQQLAALRDGIGCPLAFVLGNHDVYAGSIRETQALARRLTAARDGLAWLPATGILRAGERTAIVGHDGFPDGRAGAGAASQVTLTDDHVIDELVGDAAHRARAMAELAEASAAWAREVVPQAWSRFEHVVFVTHVPPFLEAVRTWPERELDQWLPRLVSPTLGAALLALAHERPDRRMTVLCGHSHHEMRCAPAPNLEVFVAGAKYGAPRLQRGFEFE